MGLRGTEPALGWSQQPTTDNQQLYWGVTYIYMLTGLTKFSSKTCICPESQTLAQEFFFLISWRLITLQYFSGFCHTLKWISHGFTCIPHPDPPSHLPLHLIPLVLPSAPGPSTCLIHPNWAGDLFHPRYYICFDAVLGCGEKGTLLHCWWECKLVQLLWKTVWRFLRSGILSQLFKTSKAWHWCLSVNYKQLKIT